MSTILTSIHGRSIGLDERQRTIGSKGFRAGTPGIQVDYSSPLTKALLDDFCGQPNAVDPLKWGTTHGTDASAVPFAQAATGAVGSIGISAGYPASGISIFSGLRWLPSRGDLVMQARVQASAINELGLFVGLASTQGTDPPILGALGSNVLTADDTNAGGFVYNAGMTTHNFWCAAGVGPKNFVTGHAPTAGAFVDLRIEVDTNGDVKFFINGDPVGTALLKAALATGTALTPIITAYNVPGGANANVTVDYLSVSSFR